MQLGNISDGFHHNMESALELICDLQQPVTSSVREKLVDFPLCLTISFITHNAILSAVGFNYHLISSLMKMVQRRFSTLELSEI